MARARTLADLLGTPPRNEAEVLADAGVEVELRDDDRPDSLVNVDVSKMTAQQFCEACVNSYEFRRYIVNALALGDIPAGVVTHLMNRAWGKVPDKIEHTGKDGAPIETVTEVRRVIVRRTVEEEFTQERLVERPTVTH